MHNYPPVPPTYTQQLLVAYTELLHGGVEGVVSSGSTNNTSSSSSSSSSSSPAVARCNAQLLQESAGRRILLQGLQTFI